ncbi:hypothetical protein LXL04_035348 [Taraxacum kok-saghyz]
MAMIICKLFTVCQHSGEVLTTPDNHDTRSSGITSSNNKKELKPNGQHGLLDGYCNTWYAFISVFAYWSDDGPSVVACTNITWNRRILAPAAYIFFSSTLPVIAFGEQHRRDTGTEMTLNRDSKGSFVPKADIFPSGIKHITNMHQANSWIIRILEETQKFGNKLSQQLDFSHRVHGVGDDVGLIGFRRKSLYSPDVLNGLKPPGLPLHRLILKVGIPVMLLRNLDQKAVVAVSDGLKAWEVLKGKSQHIDLILTEVELPSISGFALLTLITEHQVCKNIPLTAGGNGHQEESDAYAQQKVEATAENNATSNRSSGYMACIKRNRECIEKGSDAQSSCTKPDMEADAPAIEE